MLLITAMAAVLVAGVLMVYLALHGGPPTDKPPAP